MQYKCQECNDTGGRDKIGAYFDCNACDTAATRRDLNDFVKSLTQRSTYPPHPEDIALAIHQRALAMAPKQEAQEHEPVAWVNFADNGNIRIWTKAPEFERGVAKASGFELVPLYRHAAPAAANGALTDADILGIIWKYSSFISAGNYSSTQFDCQADTLNCVRAILAAAGPDAALTELHVSGIARYLSDFTSSQYNVDKDDAWKIYGDDEIERMRAALTHAGIALSGAKGN